MAFNINNIPILTRETLAPLKNKGNTLEDVCAHFRLSLQELLDRFVSLEVFNWTQPNGEVIRVHGFPGTLLNIRTEIRGGEARNFAVPDQTPFLDVLDIIEEDNAILRGRYDMTYVYHAEDHPRITVRTHSDWHAACDSHRDLHMAGGINVMTFRIKKLDPLNHRDIYPAEQRGAGF